MTAADLNRYLTSGLDEVNLGRRVVQVETFNNCGGTAAYHIIYLSPSGFVNVSADDGDYDPSANNPLRALVTDDLNSRVGQAPPYGLFPGSMLPTALGANGTDSRR